MFIGQHLKMHPRCSLWHVGTLLMILSSKIMENVSIATSHVASVARIWTPRLNLVFRD